MATRCIWFPPETSYPTYKKGTLIQSHNDVGVWEADDYVNISPESGYQILKRIDRVPEGAEVLPLQKNET